MPKYSEQDVLDAIRKSAQVLGRSPSRSEFAAQSEMREYHVLLHFSSWSEAVRASGLEPNSTNLRLDESELLQDWGEFVRVNRCIPTRHQYRREGKYSLGVFEKRFGPWSNIPSKFRDFAKDKPEWADVVALLPMNAPKWNGNGNLSEDVRPLENTPSPTSSNKRHSKLSDRPTYGNPIDFRGLRHEPVNENGVVFLFGMVARELGYSVEIVQAGFPDCEAKRQIGSGKWQRVSIEFEFESRNFRDHGHPPDGCDLIVCWNHNWLECPPRIEVIELKSIIKSLASSDD